MGGVPCQSVRHDVVGEELAGQLRDFLAVFFEGEMTCVEQVNLYRIEIILERAGALWTEDGVVFTPDNQRWWLVLAEIRLPLWVLFDVCVVIRL